LVVVERQAEVANNRNRPPADFIAFGQVLDDERSYGKELQE
jgi:hypothetical protein